MKVLVFGGSLRKGSFNGKMAVQLAEELKRQGAEVDLLPLRDAELPLYDEDLQASVPEPVKKFKERILAADGVVLVSPEYNYSIPGVIKNAIDWASRPPATNPFKGKLVQLAGCTNGGGGTVQGQQHLRHVMSAGVHAWVMPGPPLVLSGVDKQFADDGTFKEEAVRKLIAATLQRFLGELKNRVQPKG